MRVANHGIRRCVTVPPVSIAAATFAGGARKIFPPDYGFSLRAVYPVWLAVVAIQLSRMPVVCEGQTAAPPPLVAQLSVG